MSLLVGCDAICYSHAAKLIRPCWRLSAPISTRYQWNRPKERVYTKL